MSQTGVVVVEGGFMRTAIVSGVIWFVFIFCIWAAAQSSSQVYKDLVQQGAKQQVLENEVANQNQAINELKNEIRTNREVTQQVGSDLYVLKGVFIGFGGLMTFLQFLTVLTNTKKKIDTQ